MKLSYKVLKLCLRFRRCKDCKKVMFRAKKSGGGQNYCPLCRHLTSFELKLRRDYEFWYERKGKALENVLPNPMPKDAEIRRMFKELREKP